LEPADATPQAGQSASSDQGKLHVFISYSRDDLKFADQLDAALNAFGFECLIDRHGISGGEDWKRRLGNLISGADTIVFVLSPSSARSEICAWEVEEAARLNKRILPIICRALEGTSPPPRLQGLNYMFFYEEPKLPGSGFGKGLAILIDALNTDLDWLREHTRYLQRATEWDKRGRPANRLLSGDDIAEAKAWAARRPKSAPEPTTLHFDFIRASEQESEARSNTERKQLEAIAAAQVERETALHEAEAALKQAAVAQRKRARIRNIALVAVSILAILLALFVGAAVQQRQDADAILGRATNIIVKFQTQMDVDTKKEAFAVFQRGASHDDPVSMENLAIAYATGLWGVAQDYDKAREWHEKAAAKGNAKAMVSLGYLYKNGQSVARDPTKAREWFEKAAALGSADAKSHLEQERELYEKAEKDADKGDANAMADVAVFYMMGTNVARDYGKAREWFAKAADKGNVNAMVSLGVLYATGKGVAQDYAKAREWFAKAAESDDEKTTAAFGLVREWFENAAAEGDTNAMDSLGLFYADGLGVARDYAKAREWYEKAAAHGNASAKGHLEALPIK